MKFFRLSQVGKNYDKENEDYGYGESENNQLFCQF